MTTIKLAAFSLLGILGVAAASQASDISILGAGTYSSPSIVSDGTKYKTTSTLATGGGILAHKSLGASFGFETGALYINRTYSMSGSVLGIDWSSTETDHSVIFPLMAKFKISHILSFGAGGYLGRVASKSNISTKIGTTTTTEDVNQTGAKNEFGAIGDLTLRIPFGQRFGVRLDGAYLYGTNNVGSDGDTVKFRDLILLAGFQIFF